jgi:hypothetical protein
MAGRHVLNQIYRNRRVCMVFEKAPFSVQGGMDFSLPYMQPIHQHFLNNKLENVSAQTIKTLRALDLDGLAGKKIGITAGSRGISGIVSILASAVEFLKERGASPFILPAMGSHGGATASGQEHLLQELGITEQSVGAPVISSMEVTQVGTLFDHYPIYYSKTALEADGIIVCGRIKPHTSIRGLVESGLCKMMVVGMGKHLGTTTFHRQGYHKLADALPRCAQIILDECNILCGLGIVENAFDETMHVEAILPERLIEREGELLAMAKECMPRFFLDEIDVLIIDQIGKDISGAGMDPNITGRAVTPLPMTAPVPIHRIVVLDLTEASHGNATGIGGADITTRKLVEKIDFGHMYTNVFTSGALIAARLPVILDDEEQAVKVAIRCAARECIDDVKVVRIRDTLHMTEIEVSENYLPQIRNDTRISLMGDKHALTF